MFISKTVLIIGMRSQDALQERLESCKEKLENGEVEIEEFYEGRIRALEKILDSMDESTAVRMLRKSNNMVEMYDQFALMLGSFADMGQAMTRQSAFHDGIIIECSNALEAELDLQSEKNTVHFDGRTEAI